MGCWGVYLTWKRTVWSQCASALQVLCARCQWRGSTISWDDTVLVGCIKEITISGDLLLRQSLERPGKVEVPTRRKLRFPSWFEGPRLWLCPGKAVVCVDFALSHPPEVVIRRCDHGQSRWRGGCDFSCDSNSASHDFGWDPDRRTAAWNEPNIPQGKSIYFWNIHPPKHWALVLILSIDGLT